MIRDSQPPWHDDCPCPRALRRGRSRRGRRRQGAADGIAERGLVASTRIKPSVASTRYFGFLFLLLLLYFCCYCHWCFILLILAFAYIMFRAHPRTYARAAGTNVRGLNVSSFFTRVSLPPSLPPPLPLSTGIDNVGHRKRLPSTSFLSLPLFLRPSSPVCVCMPAVCVCVRERERKRDHAARGSILQQKGINGSRAVNTSICLCHLYLSLSPYNKHTPLAAGLD